MLQAVLSQFTDVLCVFMLLTWVYGTLFGLTSSQVFLEIREMKPAVQVCVIPAIIVIVGISLIFYWKMSTIFIETGYHIYSSVWWIVLIDIFLSIISIGSGIIHEITRRRTKSLKYYLLGCTNWILYAVITAISMFTFIDALAYFREWL